MVAVKLRYVNRVPATPLEQKTESENETSHFALLWTQTSSSDFKDKDKLF